jgi:hypothetical protein
VTTVDQAELERVAIFFRHRTHKRLHPAAGSCSILPLQTS